MFLSLYVHFTSTANGQSRGYLDEEFVPRYSVRRNRFPSVAFDGYIRMEEYSSVKNDMVLKKTFWPKTKMYNFIGFHGLAV